MTFAQLGLSSEILHAVNDEGYVNPTPIQAQVIPSILAGKDVMASAQTGTGKTAGFTLPLLYRLQAYANTSVSPARHPVRTLIMAPTRELAMQIDESVRKYGKYLALRTTVVFGGINIEPQIAALQAGVEILVATPGRLLDLVEQKAVNFSKTEILVLDEADRMLDMGFYDDIMFIINHLPARRQNLLFSATMPSKIRELAKRILTQPAEVNISISKPPEKIKQTAYHVFEAQKVPLVVQLLSGSNFSRIVVFCSSKLSVKQLTRELRRKKLKVDEIHSDLEQDKREEVLMQFKSGRLPILVATDILSRGIDIDNIDLVINFDVPHDGEDYVHRIGRTARAEADGTAFTLVSPKDQRKWWQIEKLIERTVPHGVVPPELGATPAYSPRQPQQH
ncbi:MAG: DEAD/DEAH box helicase, partial [Nitrosomonas sp.]|nr:DEAD/DEAH box helicase [Nitrosomonas sp.]